MGRWITVNGHHVYLRDPDEVDEKYPGLKDNSYVVEKKVTTTKSIPKTKTFEQEFADFKKELANRPMGNGKGQVPQKHQDEYKTTKRQLDKFIREDNPDTYLVNFAQGFLADSESTMSLNNYQRMIANDVRKINFNRQVGNKHITEDDYKRELRVLRSLDAMIQDRRKLLDKIKRGEW